MLKNDIKLQSLMDRSIVFLYIFLNSTFFLEVTVLTDKSRLHNLESTVYKYLCKGYFVIWTLLVWFGGVLKAPTMIL